MARVLVVDDDMNIHNILKAYLQPHHTVLSAWHGEMALNLLPEADVLIVDWMMPELSGIDFIQHLRSMGNDKPVLLLTARAEENDKLQGLYVGADDYVVKPFSPKEVVARVQALLRRTKVTDVLQYKNLKVFLTSHKVVLDNVEIELSKIEFNLLSVLMKSPDKVWSREQLLDQVWGNTFPEVDRVVDMQIKRLRKKLSDDPEMPSFIETVRGVGYRFKS